MLDAMHCFCSEILFTDVLQKTDTEFSEKQVTLGQNCIVGRKKHTLHQCTSHISREIKSLIK